VGFVTDFQFRMFRFGVCSLKSQIKMQEFLILHSDLCVRACVCVLLTWSYAFRAKHRGCLRMGCSGVTKWGAKLHKDELRGVHLSSRTVGSYCEGWDGRGMQSACDEREIRNSCLLCLRCVAQGGWQKSQRDACCRRLWSSVDYAALPYLLGLYVRWDVYRSQYPPPPRTWAAE
jgi:hypothetical protein